MDDALKIRIKLGLESDQLWDNISFCFTVAGLGCSGSSITMKAERLLSSVNYKELKQGQELKLSGRTDVFHR